MEKIFEVLGCEGHQRVTLAVYRLEGEADQWWNLIRNTRTQEEISTLTWEEFKRIFLEKYFPQPLKSKLVRDFMTLTQGDGETISEYEAKFTRLARFAPHLVANPYEKIEKFQYGLKPSIRRALAALDFITYESLV